MRHVVFAAAVLAAFSSASACPMQKLTEKLQASDEHVAWFDFWQDIDEGKSSAETGLCDGGPERPEGPLEAPRLR